MVYQEQVMQAAQFCAGYTLGGADLLRRAMGTRKTRRNGQAASTFTEDAALRHKILMKCTANHIFDDMEKFAGYGFNKSHPAAYALVASIKQLG